MNIPVMLWLRNLALAYDMLGYGKMRYNLPGNGGHWFPGLNAEHVDELDIAKATAHSPFKDKIPRWLREIHAILYETLKQRLSQS